MTIAMRIYERPDAHERRDGRTAQGQVLPGDAKERIRMLFPQLEIGDITMEQVPRELWDGMLGYTLQTLTERPAFLPDTLYVLDEIVKAGGQRFQESAARRIRSYQETIPRESLLYPALDGFLQNGWGQY